MLRDDVLDVLERIPPADMTKTVLVLRFNAAITIDCVVRQETDYLVVRGREAGTNDEGRAFFVPYEDILYVKLDRVVKLTDIKRMFGEKVSAEEDADPFAAKSAATTGSSMPGESTTAAAATATPMPVGTDPASIAKQNLLARIRAARSAAGSTSSG